MKVTYDPVVDALKITLSNVPIAESDEQSPGVILDYDQWGNVVGLEILNAQERMDNPRSCEYSILTTKPELVAS
ncbi:MAG: DUF2283 domain-containing protein [Microcystis sp. 53598_E5]|jgi:uncharacterized protein YuzE|uniref:DUF2283 domain-containing protein n=1 Tax=Microcystis aeruginosa TAIHU98 TaxID=1134457 RepID=L7EAY5_MICAE|nr:MULTISPECIES: DUF2283 domain-containing protein [Microcystis]MCE2673881.1 DUF2283 domain-containing protein [Microcystis sp. 53598_E5]ELP56174.1 hypothetical protein O53_774 [Microcystis aeruginosa TAIHU98]MBE9243642.1 DUF2283 domain-containing protein [Microcystis aeruginosa LEGE 00239]MCA2623569.1 DUF2283 domain-containing protein [Microcystis sp. M19BS1]MCA2631226.1 DUF2283 domain-containing protein [Microcystis sp. M20BS1]